MGTAPTYNMISTQNNLANLYIHQTNKEDLIVYY
jgi:hypothetical protein